MATYNITNLVPNVTSGNKSITIEADDGYNLPSSVSVSGGTLVSYNSSTGVAVVSGDNAVVSATCEGAVLPYLTFSSLDTFTLNTVDNTKRWNGNLEYSTDTITWNTWSGTTTLSSSNSGTTKYLYLRGKGNRYITGSSATSTAAHWVLTGNNIDCHGNIETLLNYEDVVNGEHPLMGAYCYSYMFYGCTSLTTAPTLPATTLTQYCYSYMFHGCTSLTTAPALPAETLAQDCYEDMFYKCTSLTTAPTLPATTLTQYCYEEMFCGCTSLTTAPALPATTLTQNCYYQMFYGCTSLTKPAIMAGGMTQAVSAKRCCYRMYNGCTNLNMYTSSSGHVPCYKAITYATNPSATAYQSSYRMFYNCKINGSQTTTTYLTAGTQYYC